MPFPVSNFSGPGACTRGWGCGGKAAALHCGSIAAALWLTPNCEIRYEPDSKRQLRGRTPKRFAQARCGTGVPPVTGTTGTAVPRLAAALPLCAIAPLRETRLSYRGFLRTPIGDISSRFSLTIGSIGCVITAELSRLALSPGSKPTRVGARTSGSPA